jgi:hypothetical protein
MRPAASAVAAPTFSSVLIATIRIGCPRLTLRLWDAPDAWATISKSQENYRQSFSLR